MKDVQKKLVAISTKLSSLVKQVEKMAEAIEKGSAKAAPAKKVKAAAKKKKVPAKKVKAAAKKKKVPAKKAKATVKKKVAKKKPAAAPAKATAASGGTTMLDSLLGMISRSRNGITVERLKQRTGLKARQVSNALYKLTKKGKIETISRGVYIKKKS